MNPPDNEITRTAADYWHVFLRVVPIALFGGVTALGLNLTKISKESTWLRRACTLFALSATGALSAVVGVLGLSLFIGKTSPEIDIVISGVCGSLGKHTFDIYTHKLFHVKQSSDKTPSA